MVTRWFCEIDPHCRNILARHWPGVPIYGDITAIDWSGVEPVDVLAGGFPCQPGSNAGKRLGTDDERWLWPEFARAIRALAPRYVLVENVAALLGRGFEHVITDLAALGYDAEWDCIPAAAVGAPHLRDRLWIVAYAQRCGTQPVGVTGDVLGAARGAESASPQRQRRGNAAGDRGEVVADANRRPVGAGLYEGRTVCEPPIDEQEPIARHSRPPLADAIFAGLEGHERGVMALAEFRRSNADPARSDRRQPESGLGGHPHGLPTRLERHRWPAPPGPQYEWEPVRIAKGIPQQRQRLKADGNAVVPQVVEWIGRRIVAFDEEAVA